MHLSRRRAGRLILGATVAVATALVVVPSTASAANTTGTTVTTGATQTYVVLFKGSTSPGNAATLVRSAGGSVVADYSQIGVLIARSDNTAFAQMLHKGPSSET